MTIKINWDKVVQTKINKRGARAAHFFEHVFGITEYFITDASSLMDFQDSDDPLFTDSIQNTCDKTYKTYGFILQRHHFSMPLWKLLDELERFFTQGRLYRNASKTENTQREWAIDYFFDQVFGVRAFAFADPRTLGDYVNVDDPMYTEIVNERVYRVYGTRLTREHYEIPLWQLVDELEANCLQSELME